MNNHAVKTLALAAALFGLTSCVTEDVVPDEAAHDQKLLGEPEATCGSCQSGDARVNDDGTLELCEPCDGTVVPPPDGVTGPVIARLVPDGKTAGQCIEEFNIAMDTCRADRSTGYAACYAAFQADVNSCMSGVYERCGTTTPSDQCVINGRRGCLEASQPAFEACNGSVTTGYRRCHSQASADYYNCVPLTWVGRRIRSVIPF